MAREGNRLWIRWIHGFYIKQADIYEMKISNQCSWVVKKILGAREYLKKVQDGREWLQKPSFSIKNLYKVFSDITLKVPWAKLLCQNSAPAKCVFISWPLMQNSLATCSYLLKVRVQVDPVCCFCKVVMETKEHMFFQCEIPAAIWKGVMEWCGFQEQAMVWSMGRERLLAHCTTNSGSQRLYRCAVTVLVYHVWRERNLRRMQRKTTRVEDIVKQCQLLIAVSGSRDKKLAAGLRR